MAKMNYQEQRGRLTPLPSEQVKALEVVDGEVVAPNYRTTKPKMAILQSELTDRRNMPPEQQYAAMKQKYKLNTNVDAFMTSGTVSDLIASVCFYRRPDDPTRWLTAPKFISAAELQGAVDAYFEIMYEAAKNGSELVPDGEHLYLFLGITKVTAWNWKKNPQFAEVMEGAMNRILVIKKQLAMHNKIPQLVYMNDIQNNHGYRQKDRAEETAEEEREIPNIDELVEKVKYLPG